MRRFVALSVSALLAAVLGAAPALAQKAYITNTGSATVSVIATASNTVIATIPVGSAPTAVAVAPDGSKVYVANSATSGTVSVIATASNTVIGSPITVGNDPIGVAVTPDGSKVYVANNASGSVSVIATASNTVIATIPVGSAPEGVAVTPDGSKVYVANEGSNTVSVIATATNTLIGSPITVASSPVGVAVTPNGSKVYVANLISNSVSVIATASNTVTATISVGASPLGVAVSPDGSKVYVTNASDNTVSVIATASNAVIATIPVGSDPKGVAVTPDGSKVYVANASDNTVSVIATASNAVIGSPIAVGSNPQPLGSFIGPPTLTVGVAGTGSGQVTSSPANITCGVGMNACSAMFPDGTQVTLTASAASGSAFAGWSGGGCSGTGTCVITPTVDTTVTATFTQIPSFNLSVALAGTGSGAVMSNPSGINCGVACQASYQSGTQVALTAVPAGGSIFSGWSGGGCSGTGGCTVTMNSAQSVSASFVAGNALTSLVASVVPSSQSVEVGATATAMATIINGGSATASQCAIAPIGPLPATFSYQALPGGTVNTPVDIPAGGTASFFISLTPTGIIAPGVNVAFSFACANAPQATVLTGVNTLFLSAATTPVANIVATAIVANNSNGILAVDPTTGSAEFSVSTTNQGIGASITVSANTGAVTLPVTITLCQTAPTSGQCLAPPGPSVTLTINAGATPTFAVFVTATGVIPFDFNNNRIFVQFTTGTTSPSAAAATTTTLVNGQTSVAPFTPSNPSSGGNSLFAAVLPLSRSVEAGATPTAFATIINPNSSTATSCAISPYPLPANFLYQTTDPTTNALTGTANTPVDIAAGQAQSFVVALNPTAVFGPTNVEINFACNNAGPAAINVGVNTLSLSAATAPVPDVIALAASGDPGYVDIPGATGTGVFAVATINLGTDATITAAANTGTANLPVTLTVCQTNPTSGVCMAAPAPSATTEIQPNATPTFGIFVTGSADVANLPGANRVFVTLTDSTGTLRGETSVAVRTQ